MISSALVSVSYHIFEKSAISNSWRFRGTDFSKLLNEKNKDDYAA